MRGAVAATLVAVLMVAGCSGEPPLAPAPAPEDLPSRPPLPSWTTQAPESFTVVASGDVLIHPALTEQAVADGAGVRDYRPLLAGVRSVVSAADLALCHLEVPLGGATGPFSGWPAFNSPPEVATALAETGYDACSTASNHTLDRGPEGVRSTLDALDAVGLAHTGSARSAQEAATPRIIEVAGAKVGHVSFTFGFNGFRVPGGTPWLANQLDAEDVLTAARAARAAGAEVVIASLHWGEEFVAQPSASQRSLARRLLADPAIDLIVGHHAHVVQPFEQIDGKWVAYGLGNHVARHAEPRGTSEEGVIARFRFARSGSGWVVDQAEYVPTLVELGPPIRLVDLTAVATDARRAEALGRIDQVVLAAKAPLSRPGG